MITSYVRGSSHCYQGDPWFFFFAFLRWLKVQKNLMHIRRPLKWLKTERNYPNYVRPTLLNDPEGKKRRFGNALTFRPHRRSTTTWNGLSGVQFGLRESDLLITSMITDRIGRHELLLPISVVIKIAISEKKRRAKLSVHCFYGDWNQGYDWLT